MPENKAGIRAMPEIQRLTSLDALRGFDMFWILGADSIVYAIRGLKENALTKFFYVQLDHAEWAGFHFYDLIFPMFVFIMGVSTVFSLTKIIEREGRASAVKRVLKRGVLLFIVALIYSGGFTLPWPDMRLMGVMNRIALCYTFGGLLFIFCNVRVMASVAVALLLGYWALLAKVPIRDIQLDKNVLAAKVEATGDLELAKQFRAADSAPGINPSGMTNSPVWTATQKMYFATTNRVTGKYEPGYNVVNHFDFEHLPARKYDIFYDPEGYLSTLPAFVTGLLGIFTGLFLWRRPVPTVNTALCLIGAGAASAALGWAWNIEFPVIKKIWTSSYVLVAGGYAAMLLGLFYYLVDVKKWQTWCQPFIWIGMNPITLYLASNLMGGGGFERLSLRFSGGPVSAFMNAHVAAGFGHLVSALVGVLLFIWFARFLYQRKIFLRL